ncbi:MAG: hypothetical protein EPO31_16035 [Gammaproteobacteria bacterium]|nr:MAG: hypothetical protein EPO31_16035 [Gammaproteobacteria bacterium]
MDKNPLPEGALTVLLKEYDTLRDEVKERLKTAFSHVAYAGGIVAFALPAADKIAGWAPKPLPIIVALVGAATLCWVAFLNMRWVQHCGAQIQLIEDRVNSHFGCELLHWEHYAATVQAKLFFLIPKKPRRD